MSSRVPRYVVLSVGDCAEETEEEKPSDASAEKAKESVPGEFHGKKTKLVAKTGGSKVHQWTILEKQGIPPEEIPKFVVGVGSSVHRRTPSTGCASSLLWAWRT